MRNIKKCPKCNKKLATAIKTCPKCSHSFFERRKKHAKFTEIEWTSLKKGDRIQLVSRDYFLKKGGEALDMGHSGKFTVMNVTENGMVLYGATGFCFQNMTFEGDSKAGFKVQPPKVGKIK